MDEKEYREAIYEKAKKVKTKEDLDRLLSEVMADKTLDYGKIVYAISGCMFATANLIDASPVGGITGFQAGCIGWEMIRKFIKDSDNKIEIVYYEDMLYPQYEERFERKIDENTWCRLQDKAKKLLAETAIANPKVIEHWKSIADGKVPFGYEVEKGGKDA